MKWIVGLGNPGSRYEKTRHNIGFMAIDHLAERWGIAVNKQKHKALIGEGISPNGTKVALIKPMTFMNLSGEAVRSFMDFYKASLEDCIVVYDDLDTPFGKIRLRYKGSSGGHNGIGSIIQHVGKQDFKRIRMGISRPSPGLDIVDYVLAPFSKEEFKQIPDILSVTCDALEASLTDPFEKVMGKFNG